jgi:DNA-binding transcriptional regulator/RsmH inhibitor MraZ
MINKLMGGKIYFGSLFQRIQCTVGLGSMARWNIMAEFVGGPELPTLWQKGQWEKEVQQEQENVRTDEGQDAVSQVVPQGLFQ